MKTDAESLLRRAAAIAVHDPDQLVGFFIAEDSDVRHFLNPDSKCRCGIILGGTFWEDRILKCTYCKRPI